uniref:Uncharacterized protein n=1 Tax=Megaselia scalaris TaxID=36166 RepID=T1GW21_MEGSC
MGESRLDWTRLCSGFPYRRIKAAKKGKPNKTRPVTHGLGHINPSPQCDIYFSCHNSKHEIGVGFAVSDPKLVTREMSVFCEWVEDYQFPNSLVMFKHSKERYGCDWYPVIKVINQSLWQPWSLLKKSGEGVQLDLRGKVMYMPIAEDIPRIFTTFSNETTGEIRLSGVCWKVFKAFMEFNNGRVAPYLLNRRNEVQISPNGYANLNLTKFSGSYPIRIVDYCTMVPVISRIPSYMYLISPFQKSVQLGLIGVLIASSFMIFCISGFQSFSLSFLNSVSGLLNSTFASQISEAFIITSRCFQMLVRVYGFVFTNYYNCLLASFLATTLYGEQINTFQQLIDASVTLY